MKINYNIAALRGMPIDDARYCEIEGLDPSLANTPKLIDHFVSTQEDPKEAQKYINILLARNGLLDIPEY